MSDLVTLEDVGPLTQTEKDDELYREEITDLEARRADLELRNLEANIEHRKQYAGRIFYFVTAWMGMVFGVLLADGWQLGGFDLSDKVLLALIGGTSLNVLGLFAIVANYFFPKTPKPPGKR